MDSSRIEVKHSSKLILFVEKSLVEFSILMERISNCSILVVEIMAIREAFTIQKRLYNVITESDSQIAIFQRGKLRPGLKR